MNRKHTADEYLRTIDRIRTARPDILLSSDFIVGFPGETDADFAATLALIEQVEYGQAYSFRYSPRPGTPAARMPMVAREIIKERAARLREAGAARLAGHLRAQAGKTLRVLTERGGMGRAEDFTPVRTGGMGPGEIIEMKISGDDGTALLCESGRPSYL
jgi:threonylcarbamoyladenosine tRNA methylthiotransferase MtaB